MSSSSSTSDEVHFYCVVILGVNVRGVSRNDTDWKSGRGESKSSNCAPSRRERQD